MYDEDHKALLVSHVTINARLLNHGKIRRHTVCTWIKAEWSANAHTWPAMNSMIVTAKGMMQQPPTPGPW